MSCPGLCFSSSYVCVETVGLKEDSCRDSSKHSQHRDLIPAHTCRLHNKMASLHPYRLPMFSPFKFLLISWLWHQPQILPPALPLLSMNHYKMQMWRGWGHIYMCAVPITASLASHSSVVFTQLLSLFHIALYTHFLVLNYGKVHKGKGKELYAYILVLKSCC